MSEVNYSQGMTKVWSDGEKITVSSTSGTKWLKDNVEQIFGMGEWEKIHSVVYFEVDFKKDQTTTKKGYECISGYIPQRVIDDLADLAAQPDPTEEKLPKDVTKANALEVLRDV